MKGDGWRTDWREDRPKKWTERRREDRRGFIAHRKVCKQREEREDTKDRCMRE